MPVRILIAVCLVVISLVAQAQQVVVDLAADNRSLGLDLPDAAFASDGAVLSLDLDGYDVTPFGRLTGQRLALDLEIPLTAGQHFLSVYLFHADGSAEVILETALSAPELQGGDWSLNTVFATNYRADEKSEIDYDGIDSVTNTGSVSFTSSNSSGKWNLGAGLDAIYDRNNEAITGGDAWLLPQYALYAGYGGDVAETSVRAGNIVVKREDLLFSAYQRRGASLETAATSGRFQMKMFSVSSAPRNRFDGGYFVPSASNDQSNGVSASMRFLDNRLKLGGGFVDGKTSFGGAGFNMQNDPLIYGGDSWNLSLDSWWLEDSLWVHVERAESDFDADGIGVGLPENSDDATQAMLQLSSNGKLGAGPFEFWTAVFQYKKVGREFYSLANLALPGNLEINSAWLQGGFSSIVIDVDLAEEKTNPDDDPLMPTQTVERAGVNLAWSPATLDTDSGLWKVLGAPSLSGWAYRIDSSQPDSDALLAGFDVDNRTDDAGLSMSFVRDSLSWSIEYGLVDYDDMSSVVIDNGFIIYEPYSDSRNRQLSLLTSWVIGKRVSLDAWLQRNNFEETDFANEYRTSNFGVSGNFILVPDKLTLFASASRGRDRNIFGDLQFAPEHLRSRFASMQLKWLVNEADGARPALNLFLKGNYGRNENPGFMLNQESWAVYVGASLNWLGSN